MESNLDVAQNYYNSSRKRSFFFSRLFVISSMLVLLIALMVNISFLYSQERTSTTSQASSQNAQKFLPSLPAGCEYEQIGKGFKINCPQISPTLAAKLANTATFPVDIELPNLPAQCKYQTSNGGFAVKCASPLPPVPTVAVNISPSCLATLEGGPNTLACKDANNQTVQVTLPALPKGCEYKQITGMFYVDCNMSGTAK